jgi:hypothetical protein
MSVFAGKVVNGHIELGDVELPEGTEVEVYVHEEGAYTPTPEEEAELEAAMAEADRGELIAAEDVLREIRAQRGETEPARR